MRKTRWEVRRLNTNQPLNKAELTKRKPGWRFMWSYPKIAPGAPENKNYSTRNPRGVA